MSRFAYLKLPATAAMAMLFLAACETVPLEPSPEFTGDMAVANDYAQFFRLGPQQAGGADRSLRVGERVMLRRKEFGYSRVQLADGQVGYMANEDIAAAPDAPGPAKRPPGPRSGTRGRAPVTSGDDFSADLPLPDANLDILPEDIPLEPLPDLLPEPDETARDPAPAPAPQPTPIKESIPDASPAAPAPVSTST